MIRLCEAALIWLVMLGSSAMADVIAEEQESWHRITLAGSQRMMVERIERSVCFVMTGVQSDRFSFEASEAATRFENNLHILTHGDVVLGRAAERDPGVRQKLTYVQETWARFSPIARQIMHGDTHSVPVRQLIRMDGQVLARVEELAQEIETVLQESLVARKSLVSTINVASRQQMLAMRIAKSFCYIALDLNRASMLDRLRADIVAFETALAAMENGDYDMQVVDPPSLVALKTISNMWDAWQAMLPYLESAMATPDEARENLLQVADHSAALNELADAMVQVYLK